MRRFLDHWRPQLAILTESEIWPNLVLETAARGVPIALVNGRMSKRSYRGWRRRRLTALPLFSRLDLVLTQNALLQDWFTDLGAPRVVNTGNLKMDAPAPPVDRQASDTLRAAIGDRRILLAASTHANEEEQLAGLHKTLKRDFPNMLTIIAPRHPERGPALAEQIAQMGLSVRRRATGELPEAETDIYLADTIGELGMFYELSPLCFMGGSLVPHGGQNPIEAVKLDCGVLTGPHTAELHGHVSSAAGQQRRATRSIRRRVGERNPCIVSKWRAALLDAIARQNPWSTRCPAPWSARLKALSALLPPPAVTGGPTSATPAPPPSPRSSQAPGLQHAD